MAFYFLDYKIPISQWQKTNKWLAYHLSARKVFREILKWLHVPYYDCSCPTDIEGGLPVAVIDGVTSTIDPITGNWVSAPISAGAPTNVTQTGTSTTPVPAVGTVTGKTGIITTVSLTTAADGTFNFAFNNTSILATSVIQLTGGTTGNGVPLVTIVSVSAGSALIKITNIGTVAFNAPVTIQYTIL